MPFSLRENNGDVIDFVKRNTIKTILDVGPGFGSYARIIRDDPACRRIVGRIVGVEIYEPYIEEYHLNRIYDRVLNYDIREVAIRGDLITDDFDLIIFGDVLEHMTQKDSLYVWRWASEHATWGMISVPVIHWPQQGTENPYEEHIQDHLHTEDILRDYGPFEEWHEYEATATFFRRFDS